MDSVTFDLVTTKDVRYTMKKLYEETSSVNCTDVMCDIETTGLSPDINAIIQLAAVKFNYITGEIGGFFNRSMYIPYGRYWDESTRQWWGKQDQDVWAAITARMEDPAEVLRDFIDWTCTDSPRGGYRFWSKPLSFDFPFVSSYMKQFGYEMPYHYRYARDMNTWISALKGEGPAHVNMNHVEFQGKAHNALADCVHQVKVLLAAKNGDWGESQIEYAEYEEVA